MMMKDTVKMKKRRKRRSERRRKIELIIKTLIDNMKKN
jgi:hypothetical protein